MLKIGAHVSIAGGYDQALERIQAMGGNCMQIFSSSPRSWIMPQIDKEKSDLFVQKKKELTVNHIFFHATYLVNMADTGANGTLSKKSLITDLEIASLLGIQGVIVHVGSFKNGKEELYQYHNVEKERYEMLLTNIQEVLTKTPQDTSLMIENAGTRKIGWNIDEIGYIINTLQDKRLKVCLDTCHLHAAGYDLSTLEKFEAFLEEFDTKVGLDRLAVVHLNDSKDDLASFRDRHENIGEGNVGRSVFANWLTHERTKDLPFIIETPGFDGKGPDLKNIEIAKSIRNETRQKSY